MKHINIPIFIPHLGCPNQCVFCNQRHISGKEIFDENSVEKSIYNVLTSIKDEECEIAFFGGSFTGIDRALMIRLLDVAQKFVDEKKVCGIRMSTRPDYISQEIIDILKKYSITCVELGIQTTNNDVLKVLKRGHSLDDTIQAINLLKKANINFVGQMMIGLPDATIEDEVECANFISSNNAFGARIYPTLVLRNTELENMYQRGDYLPLSVEKAVERSAEVLKVFIKNKIPCIRIGLCDSENLHSENTFVAGPNSPSIGEMVKSRVYYDLISEKLSSFKKTLNTIVIECPKGKMSQVIGIKKENILKFKKQFYIEKLKIKENNVLTEFTVNVFEEEE